MAHIILINPELDQVETHKVDSDTFLKVYDLLHPKAEDITEGLAFGAAARAPELMEAVGLAVADNRTVHPASDALADIPRLSDAMANSSYEEPELEDDGEDERLPVELEEYYSAPAPEPEVIRSQDSDAAFLRSLQALL